MRCTEVRQRLSAEHGKVDEAVREHLEECPACAEFARVEQLLGADLALCSVNDDSADVNLATVRAEVEAAADKKSRLELIMDRIKESYSTRPAVFAGVSFATLVVALVCLVPFPSQELVGYRISMADQGTGRAIPSQFLAAAISVGSPSGVFVSSEESDSDGRRTVIEVPRAVIDDDSIPLVTITMTPHGDSVDVAPLYQARSKSLLARLFLQAQQRKMESESEPQQERRAKVRAENLRDMLRSARVTDDQVAAYIRALLRELGLSDSVNVAAVTDSSSGYRTVTIVAVSDSSQIDADSQLELMIDNGKIVATRVLRQKSYMAGLRKRTAADTLTGTSIMINVKLKDNDD
jgi:hypothetical protein